MARESQWLKCTGMTNPNGKWGVPAEKSNYFAKAAEFGFYEACQSLCPILDATWQSNWHSFRQDDGGHAGSTIEIAIKKNDPERAGPHGAMNMPSDASNPLRIGCETNVMNGPELHVDLEFEFEDVVADHAGMWVRLRAESYTFETGRWFYWWNIRDFADGLTKMHSELKGTCTLGDWDGETVLCMSMLDSVRGRIGVGGQLTQYIFTDHAVPKGDLVFPRLLGDYAGIVVSFEGLVTDQSYLPPLIAGLRRFISESGIEHRPPWP